MKVKFCSHSYTTMTYREKYVAINPAWLYMQKYYELHGLDPDINWLPPGILILDTVEHTIEKIVQEQPDILGLSVYIWNMSIQLLIAKQVKDRLPNTIIVAGGPNLSAHRTDAGNDGKDFFKEHPYFDYIGYGDGEKAFQQIIDYHSGYLPNKDSFVNIVENVNGDRKIYPYEMLDDDKYLNSSPLVNQENQMIEIRDDLANQGIPIESQIWGIEFARGCMYSCTFCDWGQNLTKKVKRRTHNWKYDIDLFHRMNVAIRESDANFGQWKEDIEIYDYAMSLYDPNRNFKFAVSCTSKLKKEASEYIIIKNSLVYDVAPVIALQDMHETVLSAINRPSISWQKIVEMVDHLKTALPKDKFRQLWFQTIIGLPEQTIDGIAEQIVKFFELGTVNASWDAWVHLPNSPAADLEYQKLWKIQIKDVYKSFNTSAYDVEDLETLYKELSQTNVHIDSFSKSSGVVGTRTMDLLDIWAAHILIRKWQQLNTKMDLLEKFNIEKIRDIVTRLKDTAIEEAQVQWKIHSPYIEKYNCIVWGAYNDQTKKIHSSF